MSCILIIKGIDFNVERFLENFIDNPYKKHLKGEKRAFKRKGKPDIYESSGCQFDLSKADFNEFEKQRNEAIHFLKKNYNELRKLQEYGIKENEVPVIGFGIENQMADFWCQTEYLEPELLKLAGELNIGIEISLYHPAIEDDETNDK